MPLLDLLYKKTFSSTPNRCAAALTTVNQEAGAREFSNRPDNLGRDRSVYPTEGTLGQQVLSIRQPDSLTFKIVKQLKEAVVAYGACASFTVTLLESFVKLNLMSSDWIQLCKACLSRGEFLLWRGDL